MVSPEGRVAESAGISSLAAGGLLRGDTVRELIFGAASDAVVDSAVDRFCQARLNSSVVAVLFRRASVGVVVGVELGDGRGVVVKAHQPREPPRTLAAVHEIQRHLHRAGFPCPRPLLAPSPLANGPATVEELVDHGEFRDTHDPAARRLMAEALAWQLQLARGCRSRKALGEGWQLYVKDRLWPRQAHAPIFDFEATAAGAEWIDAIATGAKARIARGDSIVGHSDWSGKHFRFAGQQVAVVYDWDSLRLQPEPATVGIAAITFTTNFELPGVKLTPEPDEVRTFVHEYSAARPQRLNHRQREQIAAWATFVAAYTARCEHALKRPADERNSFTAALRDHGKEYLEP